MGLFHKHVPVKEVTDKSTIIYCKDCGVIIVKESNCKHDWEVVDKLINEEVENVRKSYHYDDMDEEEDIEYDNIVIKKETCIVKCTLCGDIKDF